MLYINDNSEKELVNKLLDVILVTPHITDERLKQWVRRSSPVPAHKAEELVQEARNLFKEIHSR